MTFVSFMNYLGSYSPSMDAWMKFKLADYIMDEKNYTYIAPEAIIKTIPKKDKDIDLNRFQRNSDDGADNVQLEQVMTSKGIGAPVANVRDDSTVAPNGSASNTVVTKSQYSSITFWYDYLIKQMQHLRFTSYSNFNLISLNLGKWTAFVYARVLENLALAESEEDVSEDQKQATVAPEGQKQAPVDPEDRSQYDTMFQKKEEGSIAKFEDKSTELSMGQPELVTFWHNYFMVAGAQWVDFESTQNDKYRLSDWNPMKWPYLFYAHTVEDLAKAKKNKHTATDEKSVQKVVSSNNHGVLKTAGEVVCILVTCILEIPRVLIALMLASILTVLNYLGNGVHSGFCALKDMVCPTKEETTKNFTPQAR